MTIVGESFSGNIEYAFHVDSGKRLGATTGTTSIVCRFSADQAVKCRAGSAAQFVPEIEKTLALYDGFDGKCGNQLLADKDEAGAARYRKLATLLADDRLWVNSASSACMQFFAVDDGLIRDEREHSTRLFPFLAAPDGKSEYRE